MSDLLDNFRNIHNPQKMQEQNPFEEIADAAHENAYYCAINDAFDALKEMGALTADQRVEFIDKMKHMAEVRQATKFTLTQTPNTEQQN